jgi:endonuclease/exonuclease/phosphatase (EEP) superfamily protein YafD
VTGWAWAPARAGYDHELMSVRHLEWALAGGLAGWAAARLTGADRVVATQALVVPVLSFTPQAAAGAWASLLVVRGRGGRTAAALAGAALTATLVPRAVPRRQPGTAGPVLRVLTANLRGGRAGTGALVELARETGTDVLFVQELTGEAVARLRQAGISDLLPHQVIRPGPRSPHNNGIYARHPLSDVHPDPACAARLDLPSGRFVRLVCVHTPAPLSLRSKCATAWGDALAELPSPGPDPVILAGDYNATVDHARFRRLLRRGYVDAACQAGRGLVPTWGPEPRGHPGLLAIDHVLADRRCAVRAAVAHRLAGSDHRALLAELRLPG